jgi:hypothetical protein
MIPLLMIVHHELLEHVQQSTFAEQDQVAQALLALRP